MRKTCVFGFTSGRPAADTASKSARRSDAGCGATLSGWMLARIAGIQRALSHMPHVRKDERHLTRFHGHVQEEARVTIASLVERIAESLDEHHQLEGIEPLTRGRILNPAA